MKTHTVLTILLSLVACLTATAAGQSTGMARSGGEPILKALVTHADLVAEATVASAGQQGQQQNTIAVVRLTEVYKGNLSKGSEVSFLADRAKEGGRVLLFLARPQGEYSPTEGTPSGIGVPRYRVVIISGGIDSITGGVLHISGETVYPSPSYAGELMKYRGAKYEQVIKEMKTFLPAPTRGEKP